MIRNNIKKVLNHHASNMRRQVQAQTKITTGKRINSAADDSGGIGLSHKLSAQASSLVVAKRNIDEALEVATMADSGLNGISRTIDKLREIATRSANGIYSDNDRGLMQKEYDALMAAIDTQVNGVKYNDIPILSAKNLIYTTASSHEMSALPSGATTHGSNQGVSTIGGRQAWVQSGSLSQMAIPMGTGMENNVRITADVYLPSGAGSTSMLRAFATQLVPPGLASFVEMRQSNRVGQEVVVTERGGPNHFNNGSVIAQDQWVEMSFEVNQTTGDFTAKLGGNEIATGTFNPSNIAGDKIILQAEAFSAATVGWSNILVESAPDATLDIEDGIKIQAGDNQSESVRLKIAVKASAEDLGITSTSVSSRANALATLEKLDQAINNLATQRTEVGASANLLISEQSSVMQDHVVLSQASSEIEDVDIAEVSSELTSSQLESGINLECMKQMMQIDRVRVVTLLAQKPSS